VTEPDDGMPSVADGDVEPAGSCSGAEASANGGQASIRKVAKLGVVVGAVFVGFFITSWIQSVLVLHEHASFPVRSELAKHLFWRSWAAVLNASYGYLIIGIVICLLAVHVVNEARWNRMIPLVVAFCGLVVLILLVGFIGVVFILDWHSFIVPYYDAVSTTILFVVEVGALVAIILVETPKLRETIKRWFSKEEASEAIDRQEARPSDQDSW
jgi:hypothetical protein